MLTHASIPQEFTNTIEDLEHLKNLQFKGGKGDLRSRTRISGTEIRTDHRSKQDG